MSQMGKWKQMCRVGDLHKIWRNSSFAIPINAKLHISTSVHQYSTQNRSERRRETKAADLDEDDEDHVTESCQQKHHFGNELHTENKKTAPLRQGSIGVSDER